MTVVAGQAGVPDILDVIADLSNDEVFTPPQVARNVLDLLPDEVWSDSSLRWLDPGVKTGVFLREITRRLMVGLESEFPDPQERLSHILRNQVFGVAITELTALMSRRTLYCSKDAGGKTSAVEMDSPDGNIWFQRIEHNYEDGRCSTCGASAAQLERGEGRENYAYGFIHEEGLASIEEAFGMKFDIIVGNPPYQMDSDGGTRTMPLYNLFVDGAKALGPAHILMVTPSRWMAGGLGLGDFRASMLGDGKIATLVDYPNANEVFPGVEIKGGVCYWLWSSQYSGDCSMTIVRGDARIGPMQRNLNEFDVLVRDGRALGILRKVLESGEPSITGQMASNNEYGIGTNFNGFSPDPAKLSSDGEAPVRVHLVRGGHRIEGWMSRASVPRGHDGIDSWKVLIPKSGSDGGQRLPDLVLGQPLIAEPPAVGTQTYVFFYVDDAGQAASLISYLYTRFTRFLVSLRKISQHAPVGTYTWVPQQAWDRTWTDEELYEKYGITEDEQAYIAEMIKEMPA